MHYTKRDYHYYNIIRKNIRKYRLLKGMSITELADKLSVSSDYLNELEDIKKEMTFSLSFVFKVAFVLKMEASDLLEEEL